MIAALLEAGRNRRTSNREASRAAGAARKPGLIAIGRGLVRARESQTPIRERCRIVRRRFGFGVLFFSLVLWFRSLHCCTKPAGRIVHRGNLPSFNRNPEEEKEEEDNRAESSPEPGHGAGQGQRAAGEAVDVETSGAGLGDGNVPDNTLRGSVVPPARRVNFPLDTRTPPRWGGKTIGHTSPGREACAPQGRGREFCPTSGYARESMYHTVPSHNINNFPGPTSGQAPLWTGRGSIYEQEAGRSRGYDQSNILGEQLQASWKPSGSPQ